MWASAHKLYNIAWNVKIIKHSLEIMKTKSLLSFEKWEGEEGDLKEMHL